MSFAKTERVYSGEKVLGNGAGSRKTKFNTPRVVTTSFFCRAKAGLATVMERLLDDVSFDAPNRGGQTLVIDAGTVDEKLADLARDEDLSRYIL